MNSGTKIETSEVTSPNERNPKGRNVEPSNN